MATSTISAQSTQSTVSVWKPLPASVVLEPVYRLLDHDPGIVSASVVVRAIRITLQLWEVAGADGSPWREPFASANESGEIVLEWWNSERKLTLFFSESVSEYLQSWGDDIETEMREGTVEAGEQLAELWQWLTR